MHTDRLRRAAAIAAIGTLFGAATAVGGTGVNAVFNLGVPNTVNQTTTLSGTVDGAQLAISNPHASPAAAGLSVNVAAGHAPIKVNASAGKATNLNADKLDGLDSAALQRRVAGTCATDVEFVRGVNGDGSVRCGATARNASQLGGLPASAYATRSGLKVYSKWRAARYGILEELIQLGPRNAPATVISDLELPQGTYHLSVRFWAINGNHFLGQDNRRTVECKILPRDLTANFNWDWSFWLDDSRTIGATDFVEFHDVNAWTGGRASVACRMRDGGTDRSQVYIDKVRFTAVRLGDNDALVQQ